MSTAHNDRSRWLALYVLCVGVLMIVLDVASALTEGYHLAFVVGAVLVAGAIALAMTLARQNAPAAQRLAGAARPDTADVG